MQEIKRDFHYIRHFISSSSERNIRQTYGNFTFSTILYYVRHNLHALCWCFANPRRSGRPHYLESHPKILQFTDNKLPLYFDNRHHPMVHNNNNNSSPPLLTQFMKIGFN